MRGAGEIKEITQGGWQPRWWQESNWVYYLLAIFVALTICLSLYLNHRLTSIHTSSVRDSKQWTVHFEHQARLRQLVLTVRAAANNVFNSPDINREAAAMKAALAEFNAALDDARQDRLPVMEAGQSALITTHFDQINAAMQDMAQEGDAIVEHLRQQQTAQATTRLLKMNPYAVRSDTLLTELDQQGHQLLATRMDEQEAEAVRLENNEKLSALLIALLVGVVLVYGGRLSKRAAASARQKRQYDRALGASERRYRELVENSHGMICTHDLEGRLLSVNQAAAAALGYKLEEVVGHNLRDFLASPQQARFGEYLEAIRREPSVSGLMNVKARDGQTLIWMFRNTRIEEAGGAAYVLGHAVDVTALKQAEAALQNSEKRYKNLVNSLNEVVFQTDAEGRWAFLSPAWETVTGFAVESSLGKPFLDYVHPEDREQRREKFKTLIASENAVMRHETRYLTADSGFRWIEVRARLTLDAEGNMLGTAGTLSDITERKLAEAALREREAMLRQLGDNLLDGVIYQCVMNPEGRSYFNYLSAGIERLSGIRAEEALGDANLLLSQVIEEDRKRLTEAAREAVANLTPLDIEVRRQLPSGEIRWSYYRSNPRRLPDGTVVWDGLELDVTERKQLEGELIAAREAALNASRTKSDFLANMSHEIRTPMNAVIGMTSLLLDTPLDDEQRDYVDTIRSSSDALLTIINDILDFSKIEANRLELEQQPVDLRDCIEESLDLLAARAAEKRLELAYLIDEGVPATIVGDITRLRQVLVNLLSNGVKFTEAGEVVVRVTSSTLDGGWHELRFAVQDTGIGIPADRFSSLFQSFSQVDSSTTRHYGGTGLGLAISKQLVEMMGGAIWAESSKGHGSTFYFTIRAAAAASRLRVYLRAAPPQLAGKRLLIVDDNETNRRILTLQAQSWGMTSCAVASGSEALALIESGQGYDAAVLDRLMPGMDGLELAQAIRQHYDGQALPLVMLTSLGWRDEDAKAARTYFEAYLTKPIKPSNLYDALLEVFDRQAVKRIKTVAASGTGEKLAARLPLKILLAEDNAVNQRVALKILDSMGYRADVAANGLEVLAALERQAYDIVLMDMQMPEMDGLEATREICRRWPAEARPRIIAMTANAMAEHRQQCLAAGMDDYIAKPVRIKNLYLALESLGPRKTATAATGDNEAVASSVLDEVRKQLSASEGDALTREIFGLFLQDSPVQVAAIREALLAHQSDEMGRVVHSLKGSSAYIGASRLVTLCLALERAGCAQDFAEAAAQFAQLETEMRAVRAALEAKLMVLQA